MSELKARKLHIVRKTAGTSSSISWGPQYKAKLIRVCRFSADVEVSVGYQSRESRVHLKVYLSWLIYCGTLTTVGYHL